MQVISGGSANGGPPSESSRVPPRGYYWPLSVIVQWLLGGMPIVAETEFTGGEYFIPNRYRVDVCIISHMAVHLHACSPFSTFRTFIGHQKTA